MVSDAEAVSMSSCPPSLQLSESLIESFVVGCRRFVASHGEGAGGDRSHVLIAPDQAHHLRLKQDVADSSRLDRGLRGGLERDHTRVERRFLPGRRQSHPKFDVTPAGLIAGFITEKGIVEPTATAIAAAFGSK